MKTSRTLSLHKLIFAISLMMSLVIALVLAVGISFYSQKIFSAHSARVDEAEMDLFVHHISKDVRKGQWENLLRKCEDFVAHKGVDFFTVQLASGETPCQFTAPEAFEKHLPTLIGKVFSDETKSAVAATVEFNSSQVSLAEIFPLALSWAVGLAFCCAIILSLISFFAFSTLFNDLLVSLQQIIEADEISPALIEKAEKRQKIFRIREGQAVLRQFKRLAQTIIQQQERLADAKQQMAQADLAAQVSHDIRSPLSALNMAVSTLKELPEDKRVIIRMVAQRINDIANNLLKQGANPEQSLGEPTLVHAVLDGVVSEKRCQIDAQANVTLVGHFEQSYGLFAKIRGTDLARVISNLLNNAVEALDGRGSVHIRIQGLQNSVLIEVQDNGKGLPKEVLGLIGTRGFSFGKSTLGSGFGLGLSHAKESVEQHGGSLSVQSELGVGTKVSLVLPKASAPSWFAEELKVPAGTMVVSIDDDRSVHEIWAHRLAARHLAFTSLQVFEAWLATRSSQTALFLVDYEFLNQNENGLELIERLQIAKSSILVTSRYEDENVRAYALKMGVQILPKTLASLIPLTEDYAKIGPASTPLHPAQSPMSYH